MVQFTPNTPPRSARGFAARLEKSEKGYICFVQTKDETGYDAFYFMLLDPQKEQAFNEVIQKPGMADLKEYGMIVASGYGRTPHKDACDKIRELFDVDALLLIEEAKQKRKKGEA